jgi:hypothetical protein
MTTLRFVKISGLTPDLAVISATEGLSAVDIARKIGCFDDFKAADAFDTTRRSMKVNADQKF